MSFVYHNYLLDQTPWLLFISPIILCSFYSRVATIQKRNIYISLSQSLRWHRKEQSSIELLLDRQGNLLVVANSFTLLFWVCFTSSQQVFTCARVTHASIRHTHYSYYIFESGVYFVQHTCMEVWILFESCYINQEWHLIKRIQYLTCLVSSITPKLEYEVMICLVYTNYYTFFTNLVIVIFHLASFTPVYCHLHTPCSVW